MIYKFIPKTSSLDKSYASTKMISSHDCKKMCDDDKNCFYYFYNRKNESCNLYDNPPLNTIVDKDSLLGIKNGNPSYLLLWVFLIILFLLIFFSRCNKPRH
jgi:hypothetical protein